MSAEHHGRDSDYETPNEELRRQIEQYSRFVDEETGIADRQYPDGRIDGEDDGLTSYAVSYSEQNNSIIVRYPRSVEWVGYTADSAEAIVEVLVEMIEHIRKKEGKNE